ERAVAEGGSPPGAFDLEAELLVEADRWSVVDEDRELQPPQAEPVVRSVDQRRHQARPDAASMKIVVHAHAHVAYVVAAPLGAPDVGVADDLSVQDRDDSGVSVARALQELAHGLAADERQAQRAPAHARQLKQGRNLLPVARLARADRQAG